MPTIDQDILAIRNATFGFEIREALADAIEQLKNRVVALEQQNQSE